MGRLEADQEGNESHSWRGAIVPERGPRAKRWPRLTRSSVSPDLRGDNRAKRADPESPLLAAPLELAGDWGESSPGAVLRVLSRTTRLPGARMPGRNSAGRG
jgi:hypothetical protein